MTRYGIAATFVLALMLAAPGDAAFNDLVARKGTPAIFVSGL